MAGIRCGFFTTPLIVERSNDNPAINGEIPLAARLLGVRFSNVCIRKCKPKKVG